MNAFRHLIEKNIFRDTKILYIYVRKRRIPIDFPIHLSGELESLFDYLYYSITSNSNHKV